ncbi:Protein ABCI7 chloroplastic [Quillaja saponaria]|uniref:Protein ABCI7 chloroplastic n=1 Tax=Quillaja saponaria TaxID=32244 RepID=A0AAD7QEG8_QUISA|nr:Protein ABCI7 chloroplastic [Quillaja saponaria]
MTALAFTPHIHKPPIRSFSTPRTSKLIPKHKTRVSIQASQTPQLTLSDPFVLQLAETLEDSLPSSFSPSLPLQKLRDNSSESMLSTPWPSRKDEPFRFTDISFIRQSKTLPISVPPDPSNLLGFSIDTQFPNIVIVDGHLIKLKSKFSELPKGVYIGSLSELTSEGILERLSEFVGDWNEGDLFWSINGMGAPDLTVVYVPAGCHVENPIHLSYFSAEGGNEGSNILPISNPRVILLVEKGAQVDLIEDFSGGDGNKCYWTNSALEVVIGEGGKVKHSYIQSESLSSAHIKWTMVRQDSSSTYELIEVSTGGKLGRHNLHIQQLGPETETDLSTLHLSVGNQTQDLHSRLVLDHPRGSSRQLHKCIVAHSLGQAVFDGNIKVNRFAQQTNAGQLTRSLLLEPRATVNVKPNLQIIADDVKCSHGAAVSDLEASQLIYFQTRGIDTKMARRLLTFSFGGEVIDKLPYPSIREKVRARIKQLLDSALDGSS